MAALDEPALFAALRETVESHLLVVDDTGLGYAFRHALARDAVYEDMLPGERVRLHAAYGAALAREPGLADDQAAVPAALAHHWYAALDLPRALPASVTAARHAMASYAPAEAQQHLERALQIWPRVPDAEQRTGLDQAEVSRLTADAAYHAGAVDRAVSLLDQALAELPADGDVVRRALLLDSRALALRDVGHEDEAIAALNQALALLPADQTTRAHAVVLASLASSLMRTTGMRAAEPTAQRAVEAARAAGAAAEEADACITLGLARSYLGAGDEGLETLRAGLGLALELDPPMIALRGYVNLSDVLEFLGRHAEAAEAASEGLALAARVGLARTFGAYLTGNLADSLLRLGRWADVDRLTAQALGTFPVGIFAGTLLQLRAELAALSGRYDDAETELRAARRALGQTTDGQFILTMLHAETTIAHGRGDLAAARELLAAGLAGEAVSGAAGYAWAVSRRYAWPLLWLAMRVEADDAVRSRDRLKPVPATVGERCGELMRFGRRLDAGTPPARGYQAAVAAELARTDGTDDTGAWAAAAAAWRMAGEPWPLAYALLRLAEAHCRAADWKAAGEAVREASSIAGRIGAQPLAAEAAALARRARLSLADPEADEAVAVAAAGGPGTITSTAGASGREPAAVVGGVPREGPGELARFGLTEREREVFLLLATGLSNPQIGKALFISPKTVSVHVSSILAKLGVTGRIEAAAVAHRLGIVGQQP